MKDFQASEACLHLLSSVIYCLSTLILGLFVPVNSKKEEVTAYSCITFISRPGEVAELMCDPGCDV